MIVVTLGKEAGFWKARWSIGGKRHKRSLGNASKVKRKDAVVAAAEIQQELNAGGIGGDATLGQMLARVAESNAHLAEKTLDNYALAGRMLAAGIGLDTKASSLTADRADRFIAQLRTGERTEQTIRSYTRTFKAIFSSAVKIGLLRENPFANQVSTVADVDKSWAYVPVSRLSRAIGGMDRGTGALLALARLAGLRRSEALRIQWTDIDLDERRLTVQNTRADGVKTTKSRRRDVPICPVLHEMLSEWWIQATDELDIDPQVCTGLTNSNAHRKATRALIHSGIGAHKRLLHTLRKNFGTDMVALGHPIPAVADWLGNSIDVARKHYVRTESGEFRQAAGLNEPDETFRDGLRAEFGYKTQRTSSEPRKI